MNTILPYRKRIELYMKNAIRQGWSNEKIMRVIGVTVDAIIEAREKMGPEYTALSGPVTVNSDGPLPERPAQSAGDKGGGGRAPPTSPQ